MSGVSDVRRSEEPTERLTALTVEMALPLDRPENADVKAIIFLDTEDRGGMQLHGWDSDVEAIAALLGHLQAMFAANGMELDIVGIPETPEGL